MNVLITSCGRHDLLRQTTQSLLTKQRHGIRHILINEDSTQNINGQLKPKGSCTLITTNYVGGIGQHASIENMLKRFPNEKYAVCLEDDWRFNNTYDWIQASIDIMEADPSIIKVLCNSDSPHPNGAFLGKVNNGFMRYGGVYQLEPWENDGIIWHGFSWNPGVTRLDLLRQFIPFRKWEQDVAEDIYNAGYKVVRLEVGVCMHIGEGRSTHA